MRCGLPRGPRSNSTNCWRKSKPIQDFPALDSGRFMNLDNGKVVAYIDQLEGEGSER